MLGGIIVSILLWSRIARRDERLLFIYIGGLMGAFLGAKLVYVFAEGWLHLGQPDMWIQLATGKTILGALLGGYLAVELAKKFVGYKEATGDWFALIAPIGIILGRIGCLLHGCCLGKACEASWFTITDTHDVARWPAVPVEIGFNVAAACTLYIFRKQNLWPEQHFHLYLMAYGAFRFTHEFLRATPRLGAITGYQIAALAVFALGALGFYFRRRKLLAVPASHSAHPAVSASVR